ncbi:MULTISPECIES: O-antigen ligase family protein [unclassified Rathayibacter]|uniref:O-antigen ligase family protein n=1 Tax=unclassified Rathayibacter TaxID=2609250 RepID=UPI00188B9CE6|nr:MULTISPECIES: O-antigen ligase family protein [unclassified Rathayibacter]MBF4461890.1 O-antigen ligase family protein [Rathayibacter sp. VKM Ac-2879]MBF4504067.1 O-antigen ligase family protein [Rathayibacter sp. VKM Ac-2878]
MSGVRRVIATPAPFPRVSGGGGVAGSRGAGQWRSTASTAPAPSEAVEARRARGRRLQLAAVVLVTFVLTSGGRVADLFAAGRAASDGYSTGAVNPSAIGTAIAEWAAVPFLAVVAVVVLLNLGRPRANLSGLAGAAVYLIAAQVTNTLAVGGLNPTPKYWVILALVLALWSIAPKWEDLRVFGVIVTLIAMASLVTALTGQGWMRQDALLPGETKALVGTQLLAGIFPQMNVLGMTMALGLPFVLLVRTRFGRVSGLLVVLSALVLSASRTALIAAGVTILVALLLRVVRSAWIRRVIAVTAVVLVVTVMVLLPMLIHDRDALTSRGAIWMSSMSVIPDHFLVGLSTNAFTREGLLPPLIGHTPWHGHNLFVSTMVWGGIVLLAALAVFLVSVLVRSLEYFDRSMVSYLFVLMLLACSLAEMPLRIDDFDGVSWLTWTAVLAVMMVPGPPAVLVSGRTRRPAIDAFEGSGPPAAPRRRTR